MDIELTEDVIKEINKNYNNSIIVKVTKEKVTILDVGQSFRNYFILMSVSTLFRRKWLPLVTLMDEKGYGEMDMRLDKKHYTCFVSYCAEVGTKLNKETGRVFVTDIEEIISSLTTEAGEKE